MKISHADGQVPDEENECSSPPQLHVIVGYILDLQGHVIQSQRYISKTHITHV